MISAAANARAVARLPAPACPSKDRDATSGLAAAPGRAGHARGVARRSQAAPQRRSASVASARMTARGRLITIEGTTEPARRRSRAVSPERSALEASTSGRCASRAASRRRADPHPRHGPGTRSHREPRRSFTRPRAPQLVAERLEPAMAAGRLVLLDRFVDSSLAYQGAGRELGVHEIARLNAFATRGLRPDRTLLLVIDPLVGRVRRGGAGRRIELQDDAFFARIDAGSAPRRRRSRARAHPRCQLAPQELLAAAAAELSDLLGRSRRRRTTFWRA